MIPEVYRKCLNKTNFYTPAVMGEHASMFWTLKHTEHVPKRRVFSPSVCYLNRALRFHPDQTMLTQIIIAQLSMKHFREHEGVVDEQILRLHNKLQHKFARSGEVFDFAEWAR